MATKPVESVVGRHVFYGDWPCLEIGDVWVEGSEHCQVLVSFFDFSFGLCCVSVVLQSRLLNEKLGPIRRLVGNRDSRTNLLASSAAYSTMLSYSNALANEPKMIAIFECPSWWFVGRSIGFINMVACR